jgi:hypothetical protein
LEKLDALYAIHHVRYIIVLLGQVVEKTTIKFCRYAGCTIEARKQEYTVWVARPGNVFMALSKN